MSHWRNALSAMLRLVWFGPPALLALLRFALRAGERHGRARAIAFASLGEAMPMPHGEPLAEIFPRVHELRREYLTRLGMPGLVVNPLVFVHLNGTGEHLHSPLPGLEKIFALQPQLASHRHLFVDVPDAQEAFVGADAFRDALRKQLAPILESTHGGIVFVGLSRGGVAALDMAATWAALSDRALGAIAFSPPLIGDYERPRTVRDIALLERTMEQLAAIARVLPAWYLRWQDQQLRASYLSLTCFTITEFAMDDDVVLRWAAWDITQRAPIPAILRANREFAMLLKVSDDVLRQGCVHVAEAAARYPRLQLCMLWGGEDTWVPTARCADRAREILQAAGVPEERAALEILPGWSHALSRQLTPDFTALAAHIAQLTERVARAR